MSMRSFSLKPEKVVLATKLFYMVVGVGFIRTALIVFRHMDVRSPYFLIFAKLTVYLISLFIIYRLSQGSNWARWVLVVIFVTSIPVYIIPSFEAFSYNPVHSLLGILQLVMSLFAFVLIFHDSSSEWFKTS